MDERRSVSLTMTPNAVVSSPGAASTDAASMIAVPDLSFVTGPSTVMAVAPMVSQPEPALDTPAVSHLAVPVLRGKASAPVVFGTGKITTTEGEFLGPVF